MVQYIFNFSPFYKKSTLPQKNYIHLEATIEYIKDGGYYLVKYEKGYIRAWGAIKIKDF